MLTLPSTLFPSTPVFRSRERRDPDLALRVLARGGAGEAVAAVHVHRAGAANPLAAGAAEGQRRVLLALDLDERVEDHRAARVEVDVERVVARIFARVGVVAIDLELLHAGRPGRSLVRAPLALDLAVLRKREIGRAHV